MADLMIHGVDEEVMDRLRHDANASNQTVEEVARYILINCQGFLATHTGLVERVRQTVEAAKKIPKTMTPERVAELERVRKEFEKRLRLKPGTQEALARQNDGSGKTDTGR